jgi:hypothetical protein
MRLLLLPVDTTTMRLRVLVATASACGRLLLVPAGTATSCLRALVATASACWRLLRVPAGTATRCLRALVAVKSACGRLLRVPAGTRQCRKHLWAFLVSAPRAPSAPARARLAARLLHPNDSMLDPFFQQWWEGGRRTQKDRCLKG